MIKPSDVRGIIQDGEIYHLPLNNMFGKSEAEWVAAAICHVLAENGDEWRTIDVEEVIPAIEASGLIRVGIIDPLIGRARLEDDGYLVTDIGARTITPTESFISRLAERFAP